MNELTEKLMKSQQEKQVKQVGRESNKEAKVLCER